MARKPEAVAHAGAQSILLAVAAVLLSITGAIFAPEILRLMKAEERVVQEGAVFTRIMLGWQHGNRFAFLINGIFRGAGDAAIAMRSLWLASIINIFLCPHDQWIRTVPELGLKGAAIATTIGRGAGVVYQWLLSFFTVREISG